MACSYVRQTFFLQAEDGIRDYKVTGVQTCALPISAAPLPSMRSMIFLPTSLSPPPPRRSEERRVGKECSSRWPPSPQRQKGESSRLTGHVSQAIPVTAQRMR